MRIGGQKRDTSLMDLSHALIFALFALAITFQIAAIAVRKLFLSLFFSFVYTLFIAVILLALGRPLVAMACLWLLSGLSYFGLVMTSLLIGSHNNQKPERNISFSFFAYMAVIILVVYTSGALFKQPTDMIPEALFSGEYGTLYLLLAIIGLISFIGSLILTRRDDANDRI